MKKIYPLVFIFILFITQVQTQNSSAQPLPEISPESVGISSARLSNLDKMFEKAIADEEIPGAVALIVRNGNIVYHKAFGMSDNENGLEFEKNDIFRIASQTKAITSTAVMILWEEGKFRLDDPVSKFIPEFEEPVVLQEFDATDTSYTTIPADREITIRHLLTHTSGLGYGMIDGDERIRKIYQKEGITDLFTTENIRIEDSVKKLAGLPLHHHPGEKFTYSEGLDVLGYFIEIVSGMPLDEFFRERIFDSLGMDDTWFYLPDEKSHRLVSVQTKENGEWTKYPVTFYDPDYPVKGAKSFFSGGAGLSSTAKDYAAFLQMYLNKGELNGFRILSRTTVQFMMSNQIGSGLPNDPGRYYGLAFGVLNQKGQNMGGRGSKGTFDWGGYFNTQYFADPEENLIGILMKQTQGLPADQDQTAWKFRQMAGASIVD